MYTVYIILHFIIIIISINTSLQLELNDEVRNMHEIKMMPVGPLINTGN